METTLCSAALILALSLSPFGLGQGPRKPPRKPTFWERLLRVTGISATPSTQKGPGEDFSGEIWIADLERRSARQVTRGGGYRSPVFLHGDDLLLAISGDEIVRVPAAGGEPRQRLPRGRVVKLIGYDPDRPDEILVLGEGADGRPEVGLLSLPQGQVTQVPVDETASPDRLAHLRGWERVYAGGRTRVYPKVQTKSGLAGDVEWSDIFVKQGESDPLDVSRCDGVNCGQPSLSASGRLVAFIKEAR
jgi:hypothetical protein